LSEPSANLSIFSERDWSDLDAALTEARQRAEQTGRSVVAGVRREIQDLDFLSVFSAALNEERFFGQRPTQHQAFVALGCAAQIMAEGPERFAMCARSARELFELASLNGYGDTAEERPLLLGGFAFGDALPAFDSPWGGFPAARLVLPEFLLTRIDAPGTVATPGAASSGNSAPLRVALSLHAQIDAESDLASIGSALRARVRWLDTILRQDDIEASSADAPVAIGSEESPEEGYLQTIRDTLDAIGRGELEKAVPARSCHVEAEASFDPSRILGNLRRNYPSCFIFAASRSGISFLGATPERLLALRGDRILSGPLAGSSRRGENADEDARLEAQLRESKKEQREHEVVVRAIRDGLAPFCVELDVPEAPSVLKLPEIQHLHTDIAGSLRTPGEVSILDLLGELHPTPAVAGTPRERALPWLAEHEGFERGWYTGPIGWMNDRGEGDFAIALRAALLRGNSAYLHAGAGIVDGSVPEAELAETRLKMRAALSAILDLHDDLQDEPGVST